MIGPGGNAAPMPPERIVAFRPRTSLTAAALIVGVAIVLWVVWVSRRVLVWAPVSVFPALALNPAVEALQLGGCVSAPLRRRWSTCSRSRRSPGSAR